MAKESKKRQPEAVWDLIFKCTQKKRHTKNMNNIKTSRRKSTTKKK